MGAPGAGTEHTLLDCAPDPSAPANAASLPGCTHAIDHVSFPGDIHAIAVVVVGHAGAFRWNPRMIG